MSTRIPNRLWLAGRVLGTTAGATLVFGAAAVLGVVLHLNAPVARRFAVSTVNAVLADTFKGKLTIDRVEELGLTGIGGARARIAAYREE